MQKLGCSVKGIELSKWASAYARRNFRLEIIYGDISKIDFPTASFDIVTMIHVIEHLPDPVSVVKKLVKWFKPGGLLVVATSDVNSIGARLFKKKMAILHS